MSNPEFYWFRMYAKFADDPQVKLLAFDDQRHFVVLLCRKCQGILDKSYPSPELRNRTIAMSLGLEPMVASEVRRRLIEVGLIDEEWQPVSWSKAQRPSDHSAAERQRKSRRHKKSRPSHADVTESVTTGHSDCHTLEKRRVEKSREEKALRASSARASVVNSNNTKPTRTLTPEAAMAIELRNAGVTVTSMNPVLVAWIRDGITIQQAQDALAVARMRKPHPEPIAPGYLDKILRERPKQQSADVMTMMSWRPPTDEGTDHAAA